MHRRSRWSGSGGRGGSERDNVCPYFFGLCSLKKGVDARGRMKKLDTFFVFPRGERGSFRFNLALSSTLSLSPATKMAANLASDPRRPPSLPEVSLPATAPGSSSSSCVASTLLAATDALADAARALLPRLKPDPDNRRPPLSFTDAQSISQSRADERRRVQARKEKAGKASAKAFAISGVGGVGVVVGKGDAGGGGGVGGAGGAGSQQHGLLPHHPLGGVGSEFPGAVPEGESEKSAYWTFVQVRYLSFRNCFFFDRSISGFRRPKKKKNARSNLFLTFFSLGLENRTLIPPPQKKKTLPQAYFRELPAEDLADLLPMEGIASDKEEEEEKDGTRGEGRSSSSSAAAVDALARRDAAFRLPAPSGELAPLGAPLNDRAGGSSSALAAKVAFAPAPAFAAPVLPPGGPVIDVVPRPSPNGKGGGGKRGSAVASPSPSSSRPPSSSAAQAAAAASPAGAASAPPAAQSLPVSPSDAAADAAAAVAAAAGAASTAPLPPPPPPPPPQHAPFLLVPPPQPLAASSSSFPRNRGAARRERAAAADPDFYLLAGVVFEQPAAAAAAAAPSDASHAAAAPSPAAPPPALQQQQPEPRFLTSLIEGCDPEDLAAAADARRMPAGLLGS